MIKEQKAVAVKYRITDLRAPYEGCSFVKVWADMFDMNSSTQEIIDSFWIRNLHGNTNCLLAKEHGWEYERSGIIGCCKKYKVEILSIFGESTIMCNESEV